MNVSDIFETPSREEWREIMKEGKRQRDDWFANLPEAQKEVIKACCKTSKEYGKYMDASTRMCFMSKYLRLEKGMEKTPKAEVQYEMVYADLREFVRWLDEELGIVNVETEE